MTVYAYYRVSTDEQDYNNQKQGVLKLAEILTIAMETITGRVFQKENKQLRTLLKECMPLFFPYVKDMPLSRDKTLNLLTRINAALGESEE